MWVWEVFSARTCSEEGSYLRLIDFLYHSTLGLRVMKKEKKNGVVWCFMGGRLVKVFGEPCDLENGREYRRSYTARRFRNSVVESRVLYTGGCKSNGQTELGTGANFAGRTAGWTERVLY